MKYVLKPSCCTPSAPARTGGAEFLPLPPTENQNPTSGSTPGMVLLPGGTFQMGTDSPEAWASDGEGPIREVTLTPFQIDRCAVTNQEFSAFVEATGYRTEAEVFGWSYVFHLLVPKSVLKKGKFRPLEGLNWWMGVEEACWRRPEGPGTHVRKRLDHPAIHISWNDAAAYAAWAGKRLPTEAEWEFAARGGLVQATYPWGDELTPEGRHRCNIWQGTFPTLNTAEDGYVGTAPVRSYRTNGYGLYNMSGNVWEWCADWFSPTHHLTASRLNPTGPTHGDAKLMKGGSYLCHTSYCNRYRVAARTGNTPDSSTGNCGFRCAKDPDDPISQRKDPGP